MVLWIYFLSIRVHFFKRLEINFLPLFFMFDRFKYTLLKLKFDLIKALRTIETSR